MERWQGWSHNGSLLNIYVSDYFQLWFLFNCAFLLQESFKELKTSFKNEKRQYFPHYWSDKGSKGTVVNQTLPSLYGGSLEITQLQCL